MNRIYIIFLSVFWTNYGMAADFPVSTIPDVLIKDATVVKRIDERRIEIKSPGKAVYYRHYAYTILNEAGDGYAVFYSYYDKFRDINSISGTLYDAAGKKIKSVKKKDIIDESGNQGAHLAIDARFKIHNFYHRVYPYTVEYEEEVQMDGIFYFPEWMPQYAEKVSIENATMQVVAPNSYNLRYKMFNYQGAPEIKDEKSLKSYLWQVKNITAKKDEPYSPEWQELVTRVIITPTDFEIKGYKGNMKTWQGFGNFISSLYAGRDVLPNHIKATVHQLTDRLTSDREKINTLYKFMQDNTHYISIQLGIGGWQPLDATYVAEKKYGDCKALSNYMVALLKEAGIKGYNALITGGDEEKNIITDFPSNQFNHVVVCVPQKKDTVWLECTSQTVAPGYMGSFTGNREALLIDSENSRIVHTPVYSKEMNVQNRTITANLSDAGTLGFTAITTTSGLQQDDLHGIINSLSHEDQLKRLRNAFRLPSYEIASFKYDAIEMPDVPAIKETLEITSKNYANISGKRLFIRPNILSTYVNKINSDEKRMYEIVYEYPFIDRDTVLIKIPAGYKIETQPRTVTINNQFGTYSNTCTYTDGTIQLIRIYERKAGRFPASDYGTFVSFYEAINKADNAQYVFVKESE
ncbi:MAG: DUF3857 domain-containing protein [Niabella sp.]